MNNEKYNQIIDAAYENYKIENQKLADVIGHGFHGGRLTQEEFINKIKTDDEFSKTWNLKIEERELSLEEKKKIHGSLFEEWETARNNFQNYTMKVTYGEPNDIQYNAEQANYWDSTHKKLAEQIKSPPTKLITLTYNNEKFETYE
jgi:hypothetical protein